MTFLREVTYLLGGDLDANLLDGLGKFIGLDGAAVVEVKELEALSEDGLLGLRSLGLFRQFVLKFSLETRSG